MQTTSLPAHILVIEDDRDILEAMRLILTSRGYTVTALSGAELLQQRLAEVIPDIILLDIWVGGSDGRDIARMLRQDERTQRIPIILVSANLSTPQIAKDLKADDFVLKPFDADHLLDVVEKRLSRLQRRPGVRTKPGGSA